MQAFFGTNAQSAQSPIESEPSRPAGVTILGTLAILIGLFGLVGGAVLIMSPDQLVAALSGLAVLIGIRYVMTGIGFLQGVRWAWNLGLIVSVLALVRNLIEVAFGSIAFAIPGIVVALAIIYYLTRQHVKVFFRKINAPATGR